MTLYYDIYDYDIEIELTKEEVIDTLVTLFIIEGKLVSTPETRKAMYFMIERFSLYDDDDVIDDYKEDIKAIYYHRAREAYETRNDP